MQRSTTFCGLKGTQTLAGRGTMIECFMNSSDFSTWDHCIEMNVHGNLHQVGRWVRRVWNGGRLASRPNALDQGSVVHERAGGGGVSSTPYLRRHEVSNTSVHTPGRCTSATTATRQLQAHGGAWDCQHDFKHLSETDPTRFPPKVVILTHPSSFSRDRRQPPSS